MAELTLPRGKPYIIQREPTLQTGPAVTYGSNGLMIGGEAHLFGEIEYRKTPEKDYRIRDNFTVGVFSSPDGKRTMSQIAFSRLAVPIGGVLSPVELTAGIPLTFVADQDADTQSVAGGLSLDLNILFPRPEPAEKGTIDFFGAGTVRGEIGLGGTIDGAQIDYYFHWGLSAMLLGGIRF